MANFLPAIVIGGPPHAGKSVLFYSITRALNKLGVPHHAIRACPDGEGNWSQESDAQTVSLIRAKGTWSDEFVQRTCHDLEHRCLPFMVDMGARPTPSQRTMLRFCTHALLLLRTDKPEYTQLWQPLITEYDLTLLAQLNSQLGEGSILTRQDPIIEGTITGLVRHEEHMAYGPVFDALVERIAELFHSCLPHDLERFHREHAPTQLLNLYDFVSQKERWTPSMLPHMLAHLPTQTSISIYGKAPGWIYAALAAHSEHPSLYQFDPRFPTGWGQPVAVQIGTEPLAGMVVKARAYADTTVLSLDILTKHLEYFQPEPLSFPAVPAHMGLIIDGAMPFWLLTALVRLYKQAGLPWIASYYVQERQSVVVYSRDPAYHVGDLVTLTTLNTSRG